MLRYKLTDTLENRERKKKTSAPDATLSIRLTENFPHPGQSRVFVKLALQPHLAQERTTILRIASSLKLGFSRTLNLLLFSSSLQAI